MTTCFRAGFRLKNTYLNKNNILNVSYLKGIHRYSTQNVSSEIERKNELFSKEKKRQIEDVGRIEKINVKVCAPPEDVTLYMNANLSTPYDCTKHISLELSHRAALALVNSKTVWDMHKPLTETCELKFLTFLDEDPTHINRAFWESCSIILGAVISNAFKHNISVTLHSYPPPDITLGSFIYDVQLPLENWQPTPDELRILSAEMVTFMHNGHEFERLSVSKEIALQIMEGNPFKEEQVLATAALNDNKVTLYRVGNHIDISEGPLIGSTFHIGRCTISAVHKIKSSIGSLYRFQGIALPKQIMLNHFAYGILEKRARKLNKGIYPGGRMEDQKIMAEERRNIG